MQKPLDFRKFQTGTLFLVRTPDVFPVGYAEESFRDMKENLHFDYAALLETWNCDDGILWKSDLFPRSHFWAGEERDPIEECFAAADKYGMAFLPEAGMMHRGFMEAHPEGMLTDASGTVSRYGRIGLSPACPLTIDYFIEKYDAMLAKFGSHASCRGVCMPAENGASLSFDRYTKEAWHSAYGSAMPSQQEILADKTLEKRVLSFMEETFLSMYCKLARYLKQKYALPLMHYPLDIVSSNSFFQPTGALSQGNISLMTRVEELDLLNLQLHPPLYPNPYFFKCETEYLMANAGTKPCMADTHFYHECNGGRLIDATPKRTVDSILSTITPYGISFFCYGFMREELPLWKKELNPNAPVYRVYGEEHTQAARREMSLKAMGYVEQLRPMLDGTHHTADAAIFYPEYLNRNYMLGSYALEHIFGLHELMNGAAIPTATIATIPAAPTETKCILFDAVPELSPADAENLKAYLAAGGKAVVIGRCCDDLCRITGVQCRESAGDFVVSEDSTDYRNCFIRLPESGRHYTCDGGQALLRYNTGDAAISRNGNILFVGIADAIDRYSLYRDFKLTAWMKAYFIAENLHSQVEYHNLYRGHPDWHQFVSADLFAALGKEVLLLRNFGVEQPAASIRWTPKDGMTVTRALVDGKELPWSDGMVLPVYEHFAAFLAEKQ